MIKENTKTCAGCEAKMDADALFCNGCGAIQPKVSDGFQPSSTVGSFDAPLNNIPPKQNIFSDVLENAAYKFCPQCAKQLDENIKFCSACAFDFTKSLEPVNAASSNWEFEEIKSTAKTPYSQDLIFAASKRYQDGYRVAKAINGLGVFLKAIGLIAGIIIILIGFSIGAASANSMRSSSFGYSGGGGLFASSMLAFGIVGALVAAIFWLLGVLFSARGQVLKAILDSAVYASPFLTDMDKARIMSLPVGQNKNTNFNSGYPISTQPNQPLAENIKATLAYGLSFIIGILWLPVPIYYLATAPKENFTLRFHSFQSIILIAITFTVSLIAYVTVSEVVTLFSYGVWIAAIIINFICMWKVYNEEDFKLPIIGDLAANLAQKNMI